MTKLLRTKEHETFLSHSRKILLKLAELHTGHTLANAGSHLEVDATDEYKKENPWFPVAADRSSMISNSSSESISTRKPKFYKKYRTGTVIGGAKASLSNYTSSDLFEASSECIIWNKAQNGGRPLMNIRTRPHDLDRFPLELAPNRYPSEYLTEIEAGLKKIYNENNRLNTKTIKIDLQEFLWHYTRPYLLWRKPAEFYHQQTGLTSPLAEQAKSAVGDLITTCCGSSDCINPEHLTNVSGIWKKLIYTSPKNIRLGAARFLKYKKLRDDGMPLNMMDRMGYLPATVDLFEEAMPKVGHLMPAHLPVGSMPYCDNFEFSGFAELLDPNINLVNESSVPKGWGAVLNDSQFDYVKRSEEGFHSFRGDIGDIHIPMSTLVCGGNMSTKRELPQAMILHVTLEEQKVLELQGANKSIMLEEYPK